MPSYHCILQHYYHQSKHSEEWPLCAVGGAVETLFKTATACDDLSQRKSSMQLYLTGSVLVYAVMIYLTGAVTSIDSRLLHQVCTLTILYKYIILAVADSTGSKNAVGAGQA
eukprot:4125-Heterococcus_DN1.PRE.4